MKTSELKFLLLVLLVPIVTFPGSITFANWDAPYGFYKDVSAWLGSIVGGWLFLIVYGAWNWRKGRIRALCPVVLALLIVAASIVGYRAELSLHGEKGFGSESIVSYVAGGILGFLLSLMLLPSIVHVIAGDIYPYDRPLLFVWLAMIVATLLLGAVYMKERRKGLKEPRSRGP
ncbi:membrane protein [Thermococcus nautili]|uniref:Putative membrane protein n=1 Tax=Thermococcus nautili TaxID=195522 RepID=W8P0A8_9EURY|nr:membrane protein [Thermococcus nautili]AHL22156.1 putative membrane protein [Thermococcus nautili]